MDSPISFNGSNYGLQIAQNNGQTTWNAHFHLSPGKVTFNVDCRIIHISDNVKQAPEERPQPCVMIPFGRDPDFVDPGSLVDRVHALSSKPSARLALVGFGGVGKSEIAIEYAYWIREQSPGTWVFWIHATDIVRYEEGLRDIAERVKIPHHQDPTANIFQLVGSWLQGQIAEPWLLILDNIDDDEYLYQPAFASPISAGSHERIEVISHQRADFDKSPLDYLPRVPHGSIILTTRSKQVATNLVNECDIITIEPSETHALALLERKLKIDAATDVLSLKRLARELDCIALAIVQAATFIARHSPRSSVQKYLEMFQESNQARASLLKRQTRLLHRDQRVDNSIIITLQLSFELIRKENPQAMDILSFMSFFHPQSIPDYILHTSFHDDDDEAKSDVDKNYTPFGPSYQEDKNIDQILEDKGSSADRKATFKFSGLDFEDSIAILKDYSLISIDPETLSFAMHGLVQLSIQDWLDIQGKHTYWKENFIRVLYLKFPKFTNMENIARSRSLFPHIQSAMLHGPVSNHRIRWARLIRHATDFVLSCERPHEAKRLAVMSRRETENILGWEHPETITASLFEVKALMKCEEFEHAEGKCLQTIEACKSFHLETGYTVYLTFRKILAEVLHRQGSHRWAESESEYKELLAIWEQRNPSNEHAITYTKAGLAELYRDMDCLDKAETILRQLVDSRRYCRTDRRQDLSRHMESLASLYKQQGRHEEAITLSAEVLELQAAAFGREHPRTLSSMRSFASALEGQSRISEATEFMREAFDKQKMIFGLDHVETTHTAYLLIDLFVANEELEAAGCLAESLISVLDPDAYSADAFSAKLVDIYLAEGRAEKALEILTNSLARKRHLHEEEHDEVLSAQVNLALWHEKQGHLRKAEHLYQHVHQIRQRTLGSEDPNTLESLQCLVDLYLMHDGLVNSESLWSMLNQLCKSREALFGKEDPRTLLNLYALSLEFNAQEKPFDAAVLQQEILQICLKSESDFEVLPDLLEALADSWEELGCEENAADLRGQLEIISENTSSGGLATRLNSSKALLERLEKFSLTAQSFGGLD
ncbi:TPR-like protein [Penicillium angulare]|uniref:TPR-like protein n=1 Tax=Penicillium angulare TaxID=116970 RepID=UPI00254261C3|nr:TPR-like protein [Penicillium angulare]KAJ5288172.1 TPR-like protein [Penicillium angulare]